MSLVFAVWLWTAGATPGALESFQNGLDAWQQGDVSSARVAFTRAAELDKRLAAARFNLAVIAFERGQLDEALSWCAAYLVIDARGPGSALVKALQAQVEGAKRLSGNEKVVRAMQYDALLASLRVAVDNRRLPLVVRFAALADELDPTRFDVPALAGAALMREGRYRDALPLLSQAAKRISADRARPLTEAVAFCQREVDYRTSLEGGLEAFRRGDMPAAAGALASAVALHPESEDGVREAVIALGETGEWAKAQALATRHGSAGVELQRLAGHTAQMEKLERETTDARSNVPPGPELPDLGAVFAKLDRDEQAADKEQADFMREAKEREAQLRKEVARLKEEIRKAKSAASTNEYSAELQEKSAADLDRQSATYRTQSSGALSSGIAAGAAAGFRNAAASNRAAANRGRDEVRELERELTEKQAELAAATSAD